VPLTFVLDSLSFDRVSSPFPHPVAGVLPDTGVAPGVVGDPGLLFGGEVLCVFGLPGSAT
jgi:hypothetical protein